MTLFLVIEGWTFRTKLNGIKDFEILFFVEYCIDLDLRTIENKT